jgi:hypothetical protein
MLAVKLSPGDTVVLDKVSEQAGKAKAVEVEKVNWANTLFGLVSPNMTIKKKPNFKPLILPP